jgi:hypothetical protein
MTDINLSNSLSDLAARIKVEHAAAATALNESVEHAIRAGELLIEAKAKLPHGQWLPWLSNNCALSERSAQLYIRIAKNRSTLEEHIRNGVADLSLNQAAALMVMSSDVRRLFRFVKELDGLDDPEDIVKACIAANMPVIVDHNYDQFTGRTEEEVREWHLFMLLVARDGGEPQGVARHIEWILQRPFQNVAEWLGDEGDNFRALYRMRAVPADFKQRWFTFLAEHQHRAITNITAELEELERVFPEREAAARHERRSRKRTSAR